MDESRIGTALRSIRQRRGWRQEDLAARARVSRWHVSRVEQGHLAEIGLPELKTEIVDINDLMGGVDRKRRLSKGLVADFGWAPKTVSAWVAVAESRSNRRRLSLHSAVLRAAFPCDGRIMRPWLRDPFQAVAGLSFLPFAGQGSTMSTRTGSNRVRRRRGGTDGVGARTIGSVGVLRSGIRAADPGFERP